MNTNGKNKPLEVAVITALRLLIGWHMLYEGIVKLYSPMWSAKGFLSESQWILEGFSKWVINNQDVLNTVDFLNTWGLIAIGTGLILGLFTKIASYSGVILLFIYYIANPPLIGLEYSIPMEGSYLVVSKTLIEAAALLVIAISPLGNAIGLDLLIKNAKQIKKED